MAISEKGIELITTYEGFRNKAYLCSGGKWTIGWGHTKGVAEGMVITQEQGKEFLKGDIAKFERMVSKDFPNAKQNEFDALVSFYFNLGSIKKNSNLFRYISEGLTANAMRVWYLYHNASGKPQLGLKRRRASEIIMFTGFPYTTWREARTMDEPALVQLLVNIQEYLGGLDGDQ